MIEILNDKIYILKIRIDEMMKNFLKKEKNNFG